VLISEGGLPGEGREIRLIGRPLPVPAEWSLKGPTTGPSLLQELDEAGPPGRARRYRPGAEQRGRVGGCRRAEVSVSSGASGARRAGHLGITEFVIWCRQVARGSRP